MATKTEFRRMLLAHLTVISETTVAPAPETGALADLFIDGARALLLEKGLCWWDEDDIPDAVTLPLMRYVAALACSSFGKRGKGFEEQEDPARRAIAALKSGDERPTVRAEYF